MSFDPEQFGNPFPALSEADNDGVLAISEFITPELTVAAYCHGIFSWPVEERTVLWFAPPQRSIIPFRDFRIPHGTRRELKKQQFHFSVNQHFSKVIHACAKVPRADGGTWITQKIIDAYLELNRLGFAISFETLNEAGDLIGGLYGIRIGRYFSGESMFFHEPGASKYALIKTVDFLAVEYGCTWLDAQVKNHFTERFGAIEIPRNHFMRLHFDAVNLK